jgi:hypothetical protein
MKTVKKLVLSIAVVVLCIVAVIGILVAGLCVSEYVEDARMIKEGDRVVEKIENFRAIHGRLPSNLPEVGIPDDGPLYYEKRSDDVYVVWYGKRLGESGLYDSREKQWKTVD